MQNENVGSLVQKNNKKSGFFLSFMFSILTCHGVFFYLLFNVILSKEKLKILIIIVNFTVHLYFVQYQFNMQI